MGSAGRVDFSRPEARAALHPPRIVTMPTPTKALKRRTQQVQIASSPARCATAILVVAARAGAQDLRFTECAEAVGISGSLVLAPGYPPDIALMTGAVSVGDFNNDGLPDLFAPSGGDTPDRLFINVGLLRHGSARGALLADPLQLSQKLPADAGLLGEDVDQLAGIFV